VNLIATAAWVALVILPGRRWVTGIVTSTVVPLLFAIVYVAIVATTFGRTPGGFSTLAGVATLFSNPWALLAGWIHYLAFDLLIGTWETRADWEAWHTDPKFQETREQLRGLETRSSEEWWHEVITDLRRDTASRQAA